LAIARYVARLYTEGELTLREAAALLELPLRHAIDRLWRLGATGNVTAAQNLRTMEMSPASPGAPVTLSTKLQESECEWAAREWSGTGLRPVRPGETPGPLSRASKVLRVLATWY